MAQEQVLDLKCVALPATGSVAMAISYQWLLAIKAGYTSTSTVSVPQCKTLEGCLLQQGTGISHHALLVRFPRSVW